MASIDDLIRNAPDPAFRGRAVHEYGVVCRGTRGRVNVDGARILDFGCGQGIAAASFALRHPNSQVFGCDIVPINEGVLDDHLQSNLNVARPQNLSLVSTQPGVIPDDFSGLDLIYAWSVFEHINKDAALEILIMLRARLKQSGVFFLQINPLYFSPHGAHLNRLYQEPWMHLLLDVDTIRKACENHWPKSDHAWRQFIELNRLTADDIRDLCVAAGFVVASEERLPAKEKHPPESLLRIYREDVLTTEEIRLVLTP